MSLLAESEAELSHGELLELAEVVYRRSMALATYKAFVVDPGYIEPANIKQQDLGLETPELGPHEVVISHETGTDINIDRRQEQTELPTEQTVGGVICQQLIEVNEEDLTPNPERDQRILENLHLAKMVAKRFRSLNCDPSDLEQTALEGLIKAASRFDPEAGFKFATFAVPTMMGEVRRYFRDNDWMIRVSRPVKERAIEVRDAIAYLSQENGRQPTMEEIAELTQFSREEIEEAQAVMSLVRNQDSLDRPAGLEDDDQALGDFIVDELAVDVGDEATTKQLAAQLLGQLDPRLRQIIILRYWGRMSQFEIGEQMKISQVHISRLIRQAEDKLRLLLAKNMGARKHIDKNSVVTRVKTVTVKEASAPKPRKEVTRNPRPASPKRALRTMAEKQPSDVVKKARLVREPSASSLEWQSEIIKDHLNRIGDFPVLTREQEFELGEKMAAARRAKALLEAEGGDRMPPSEKRLLRRAIHDGEVAKQRFIDCNHKLVVSIAKKYQGLGLPLMDLIQEGTIGMMHAVDKFDHLKGFKFSTYATFWIRQSMQRATRQTGNVIRWPDDMHTEFKNFCKLMDELESAGVESDEISDEEIAAGINVKLDIIDIFRKTRVRGRDPVSLNTHIGENGETELQDLLADPRSSDGYQAAEEAERASTIGRELRKLSDKDRTMLEMRFGLTDGEKKSYAAIGTAFDITGEAARRHVKRLITNLENNQILAQLLT